MKKFVSAMMAMAFAAVSYAADIQLPKPDTAGGAPLMKTLTERCTTRSFAGKPLSLQQISDIMYAAYGVNRPDGRRTIPTARNLQDLKVCVVMKSGAYLYDAQNNKLVEIASGDNMPKFGKQSKMCASAGLGIVYVSDYSKYASLDENMKTLYASSHVGAAMQGVHLYCASAGLGSVVLGSMTDRDFLRTLLKLGSDEKIILGQLVGVIEK